MSTLSWIPNTGTTLTFTRANGYRVTSWTGFSGAPAEVTILRAPYQHGATLHDVRHAPRDMSIELWVATATEDAFWAKRREMVASLNARSGIGTLRLVWPDTTAYEIYAQVDGENPVFARTNAIGAWRAQIFLTAAYPYWQDVTPTTHAFTAPPDSVAINNAGDVPAPFEVTINGPVTDPRLGLAGSDQPFVQIVKDLLAGESLVVNTGPGAPSVSYDDGSGGPLVNANQFIQAGSSLASLQFPLGSSTLDYTASAGTGTADLTWRQYYVGVG